MAGNRMRIAALALLMSAAAGGMLPAAAQAQGLVAGTLEVPLNKSQVVSTDRPIARAMVGSSEIADVLPITDRSVYVLGKKMGTTSLTLYDRVGRVISIVDISVGPDVIALAEQIGQIVPGDKVQARISNKSIVLTGMVNSAGAADRVAQLAKAYVDGKDGGEVINLISLGSSQQVMVEVRFAEVSRSTGKEIGVRASARSADGTFNGLSGSGSSLIPGQTSTTSTITNNINNSNTSNNTRTGELTGSIAGSGFNGTRHDVTTINGNTITTDQVFSGTDASIAGQFTGTNNITNSVGAATVGTVQTATSVLSSIFKMGALTGGFGIFSKQFNIGDTTIDAVLNAMETRGLAKTLAQPTLIALSGEKASFLAGGEFPVPVAQSNTNGNGAGAITVEFKPFGVSLAFTPTVLGDNTINMVVEPEVSAIDPSSSLSVGGITIPGLRTRRASTTLELRDGESFAIAGLLSKDFETTVEQLPVLGSIPILGALFRSSSFKKGETELLIVVTPRLVQPMRPGQVRLPTDRVLDPREGDTFLLGQPYRPTRVDPAIPPVPDGSLGQPQAAAPAPAAPAQAAAELPPAAAPAPKEDGYAY